MYILFYLLNIEENIYYLIMKLYCCLMVNYVYNFIEYFLSWVFIGFCEKNFEEWISKVIVKNVFILYLIVFDNY